MDSKKAFGVALREYRLQKRVSQEALAHDAGLDRTYISMLELGRRSPKLDTMLAICKALQIPLSLIVTRVEELLETDD